MEHYLVEVIYPSGLTRNVQFVLAAAVIVINVTVYAWIASRRPIPHRNAQPLNEASGTVGGRTGQRNAAGAGHSSRRSGLKIEHPGGNRQAPDASLKCGGLGQRWRLTDF